MNEEQRLRTANQGLGSIFMPDRCRICNYLAIGWTEKLALIKTSSECPNCRSTGRKALVSMSNYIDVANWVGEFTVSQSPRDYTSAVVMFCALFEAFLEEIVQDYLDLHPEIKLKYADNDRITIQNALGSKLPQLLEQAPSHLRNFLSDWKEMRDKRNLFMHGKSSSIHIKQHDANKAMDLVPRAVETFAWLNNNYCLRKPSDSAPQQVAPS